MRNSLQFGWLIQLLAVASFTSEAHAASLKSHSTENEWNSPALSGLGGVGNLTENHVDQFFSDPSLPALGKQRFVLQWYGLHATYSQDVASTVSDVMDFAEKSNNDSSSGSEFGQAIDALETLQSVFGRRLTGGLNAHVLSLKVGGFSLVPYLSGLTTVEARVPALPRASLVGDLYAGVGTGYALTWKSIWDFGANLRPGVRWRADFAVDSGAIGDLGGTSQASGESGGSGTANEDPSFGTLAGGFYVPVDLAAAVRPSPQTRFSFVMRNVGGAPPLSPLAGQKEAPVYPMRLSLGGNWSVFQRQAHTILLGSELQDLMNLTSADALWPRWQAAAQYRYKLSFRSQTTFALNAGLQSGYPAFGCHVDLFLVKLEYARYTREAGSYLGQRPEVRHGFRAYSQMTF